MKKVFVLFFTVLFSLNAFCQTEELSDSIHSVKTSELSQILKATNFIADQISYTDQLAGRYKMYKTENIYNLLKLDTATGIIEIVQWSLKSKNEFSTYINSRELTYTPKIGKFELYPTNNMYQFILLDTTDGRTWHVQWGTKSSEMWIRRIY